MANGRNGRGRGAKVEARFPVARTGLAYSSDMSAKLQLLHSTFFESALRSAAHQGAVVFYNEMRAKVPKGDTGNLFDSIYRKHVTSQSGQFKQVYHTGPNKKKAPHWFWLEYGYMQPFKVFMLPNGEWRTSKERLPQPKFIPPNPYIRPTFLAKRGEALSRMREVLGQRLDEIIQDISNASV